MTGRPFRRRLGAVLGLAALLAALLSPAGPGGAADGAAVGSDRIATLPLPGTPPAGAGLAIWGPGPDGQLDGLEPTVTVARHAAPESSSFADAGGEARNVRAARLLRPTHTHAQARLRAGSATHATTLPPPRVPRSGRPT